MNIRHKRIRSVLCVEVMEQADGLSDDKRLPLPIQIALPQKERALCGSALRP